MCTVSLVRAGGLVRLMCNRDERYDRPPAIAPVVRHAGGHLAVYPVDPTGGGTWIAATGAGLTFALLNGDGPAAVSAPSRGLIVLDLLGCGSLDEVQARLPGLGGRDWPPHRLLATDGVTLLDVRVGARGREVREHAVPVAMMFTSSSLGEDAVAPHRQALFDTLVGGATDVFDAQAAFHRHRWPDRPQLSVDMRRHDAATLSITTVDLTARGIAMRYEPATDLIGRPAMLSIERVDRAAWDRGSPAAAAGSRPVSSFAVAS